MARAAAKQLAIRTDGKTEIQNWAILGLDLSLSRTGYAALYMENGVAAWGSIGSFAVDDASKQKDTWARAQAYAIGAGMVLESIWKHCMDSGQKWGLAVVMEYPDPENSYLMGVNQIMQTSLWSPSVPYYDDFTALYRMFVNASTLRSCMGISGGTNKTENQRVAQTFLPPGQFDNLDSDACDAVLSAMYCSWGIHLLQGRTRGVPLKAQASLAKEGVKLRARKEVPAGLLYDPELWTRITIPTSIILKRRDAAGKKARLDSIPVIL